MRNDYSIASERVSERCIFFWGGGGLDGGKGAVQMGLGLIASGELGFDAA